ncbi:MAG: DUF1080 domain-containing protein [Allomuricauda sp.]
MVRLTLLLVLLGITCSCNDRKMDDENWRFLFDGNDLEQWETYLGPTFGTGVNWDNIEKQAAIGHNNDTVGVFSIVDLDGERVLRISGEAWGGIFTKREFGNYHLQLQFKWGKKKWYPREAESDKRDSGLLYHGIGTHGEDDLFWLKSQEFQIQEGDCGDFWGVAGTIMDIRAEKDIEGGYRYNPESKLLTFSEKSNIGRNCKKNPDAENPSGEWNTINLYCFEGTSVHIVNDIVTMILHNSRYEINDKEVPLIKGKIELQSESAEVFYRNIKIRSIDSIPKNIMKVSKNRL